MNIAVLLSGGVDSSVVVHLLCEQGHRPSLFYIKIGKDDAEYMDCSAEEDLEMASAVARRYGLSLEVVDLHREYWDNVAAYAIEKVSPNIIDLSSSVEVDGFKNYDKIKEFMESLKY